MSAPAPAAQQPAAPRTPEQDRAAWRALIWTAAPVIATLALRASLHGHAGEAMQGPHGALQPLREAAQAASAGQALWLASRPFILSAAALLALWLAGRQALRRCGWQRLRLAALALWLLLWLAAAAWLVASHLNRTGRSAAPAAPRSMCRPAPAPPRCACWPRAAPCPTFRRTAPSPCALGAAAGGADGRR